MAKRRVRRLGTGRFFSVNVNGKDIRIDIEEDFDMDNPGQPPLKVRCFASLLGIKTGSVGGMLLRLAISPEAIAELREKGSLRDYDFSDVDAPYEPYGPDLYVDDGLPEPPVERPKPKPYSPPEVTPDELANIDQMGPEQLIDILERVQRRAQWEIMKETSREQLIWLLKNLEKADEAARCNHVKPDGTTCGSPALKGQKFCHWHSETRALRRARQQSDELAMPVLEDRFGLQLGIMRVCDLLTSKAIDAYTARVLFQGLRLAERTLNKRNTLPEPPNEIQNMFGIDPSENPGKVGINPKKSQKVLGSNWNLGS